MATIRPRNDPMKLLWRRIAMSALGVFILFSLWAVIGVFQKERESRELREEAEVQVKELQKREAALKARIASLETARGQEEALRDAYGVGKEGEAMVQIVEKAATSTPETKTENKTWLQRLFWW